MESITPILRNYVDVSKRLNDLNAKAGELRDQRRSLELDLTAEYANVRNDLPTKIDLNQSKMTFAVKKPGEWKKGWTLSKKQLQEYLLEILPEHGEDVFKEIVRKHEPKLVATDFSFDLKSIDEWLL